MQFLNPSSSFRATPNRVQRFGILFLLLMLRICIFPLHIARPGRQRFNLKRNSSNRLDHRQSFRKAWRTVSRSARKRLKYKDRRRLQRGNRR